MIVLYVSGARRSLILFSIALYRGDRCSAFRDRRNCEPPPPRRTRPRACVRARVCARVSTISGTPRTENTFNLRVVIKSSHRYAAGWSFLPARFTEHGNFDEFPRRARAFRILVGSSRLAGYDRSATLVIEDDSRSQAIGNTRRSISRFSFRETGSGV